MTAAITGCARAYAEYAGTPSRPHRWVALIKDADHGPVLWRGDEIHAAAITAQVEAEARLRKQTKEQHA